MTLNDVIRSHVARHDVVDDVIGRQLVGGWELLSMLSGRGIDTRACFGDVLCRRGVELVERVCVGRGPLLDVLHSGRGVLGILDSTAGGSIGGGDGATAAAAPCIGGRGGRTHRVA